MKRAICPILLPFTILVAAVGCGDPVHGVATPVPNLTRIVVQGSTTARLSEWVRLHVDPAATPPFSWTRNPRS